MLEWKAKQEGQPERQPRRDARPQQNAALPEPVGEAERKLEPEPVGQAVKRRADVGNAELEAEPEAEAEAEPEVTDREPGRGPGQGPGQGLAPGVGQTDADVQQPLPLAEQRAANTDGGHRVEDTGLARYRTQAGSPAAAAIELETVSLTASSSISTASSTVYRNIAASAEEVTTHFGCEHGCGFEGLFSEVERHELTCRLGNWEEAADPAEAAAEAAAPVPAPAVAGAESETEAEAELWVRRCLSLVFPLPCTAFH